MSYQHAFHTSCRIGLGAQSGFQFNAASSGLSESDLSHLANVHAGYQAPPGSPPQPTPAEVTELPVSLKYSPVAGVGPVVSRTAYVGREYRGRDGEPDTGRFGNYFSHILVGEDSEEPFGGLLPVELWQAPHWTSTESEDLELDPIDRLDPGPLDLEGVLDLLRPDRSRWLGGVAAAALAATCGGPRVVIVERDIGLLATWVAWASFALAPDHAAELTFSTYSGSPGRASDLMLCVTTPDCDVSFASYELGNTVRVIDTTALPEPTELPLYARVVDELAEKGPEAIANAMIKLGEGLDLERSGTEVAIRTRKLALVTEAETPAVLEGLAERTRSESAEDLADLTEQIPATATARTVSSWAALHAAARREARHTGSRLVDVTLASVLPEFAALTDSDAIHGDLPGPSPGLQPLSGWLQLDERVEDTEADSLLRAAARLRLVGLNGVLDGRVAEMLAARYDDESIRTLADDLVQSGGSTLAEALGEHVLALYAAGDLRDDSLKRAARVRGVKDGMERSAHETESFALMLAWELVRVGEEPERRSAAIQALASVASNEEELHRIGRLFGADGPETPGEHAELLRGTLEAGKTPPSRAVEAALTVMAEHGRKQQREVEDLYRVLGREELPKHSRQSPAYAFWSLLHQAGKKDLAKWAGLAANLERRASKDLPRERLEEMRQLAAETMALGTRDRGFESALDDLVEAYGPKWFRTLADALRAELKSSADPVTVATDAFLALRRARGGKADPVVEVLPDALGVLDSRDLDEVGATVPLREVDAWEQLLEEHPPRRAVGRVVRRVLRPRGGR